VRPAEPGDAEQFERLYVGLLEFDRPHHPQGDATEFAAIMEARRTNARAQIHSDARRTLLVADLPGEQLVGYAIILLTDPGPASTDGTTLTGVVYELFVDEAARGYGAGSALMDAAEQWFRERGAQRVKIEAYAWNDDAIAF
jgi:GNAT superfamily N-acetyltransferase